MTFSSASSSCAVPSRCRRSLFDAPELDFLRARLANVYVSWSDRSLVRESSLDGILAIVDMLDEFVSVW